MSSFYFYRLFLYFFYCISFIFIVSSSFPVLLSLFCYSSSTAMNNWRASSFDLFLWIFAYHFRQCNLRSSVDCTTLSTFQLQNPQLLFSPALTVQVNSDPPFPVVNSSSFYGFPPVKHRVWAVGHM